MHRSGYRKGVVRLQSHLHVLQPAETPGIDTGTLVLGPPRFLVSAIGPPPEDTDDQKAARIARFQAVSTDPTIEVTKKIDLSKQVHFKIKICNQHSELVISGSVKAICRE